MGAACACPDEFEEMIRLFKTQVRGMLNDYTLPLVSLARGRRSAPYAQGRQPHPRMFERVSGDKTRGRAKGDILTLEKRGHFYFALTWIGISSTKRPKSVTPTEWPRSVHGKRASPGITPVSRALQ